MRPLLRPLALSLAPLFVAACGGGAQDSLTTPGAEDASIDATTSDAFTEAATEAAVDASSDGATPDAPVDAPVDVAAADATELDATDASTPPIDAGSDAADAAVGPDAGGCTPTGCDDGFACTLDECVAGTCTHTPVGLGAPGACPASSYCDPTRGCIDLPICADDALCVAKLGGDVCKANVRCNPATAVCTFDRLDKDGDSHAPRVCGGDDCNDANGAVHPGAIEICNGVDDDCDGVVDDGATCPALEICQAGSCACLPANLCGGTCVDRASDHANCGTCGHACGGLEACAGGSCVCTKGLCGGVCTDTSSSASNCGGCGATCPSGASCSNSSCVCPGQQTACATGCTDLKTDSGHCGSCDKVCGVATPTTADASCVSGGCSMTCRGENWDVNGSTSDGCEFSDSVPPGHTQATASALPSQGCSDGTLGSFQGWIASDARAHANPAVAGYQAFSGSADDWWSVYAAGGWLCANNYGATISTDGGSGLVCYELSLWNGATFMASTTLSGASSASTSDLSTGLYADYSTLYFRVRKTCSTATSEAIHYSVSFHL